MGDNRGGAVDEATSVFGSITEDQIIKTEEDGRSHNEGAYEQEHDDVGDEHDEAEDGERIDEDEGHVDPDSQEDDNHSNNEENDDEDRDQWTEESERINEQEDSEEHLVDDEHAEEGQHSEAEDHEEGEHSDNEDDEENEDARFDDDEDEDFTEALKVEFLDGRYVIEVDDGEELKCAYGAEGNTFEIGASTKTSKTESPVASRLHQFAKATTSSESVAVSAANSDSFKGSNVDDKQQNSIISLASGGISSLASAYSESSSMFLSVVFVLLLASGLGFAWRLRQRRHFASLDRPAPLLTTTRTEHKPLPVGFQGGGGAIPLRRPSGVLLPSQQGSSFDRSQNSQEPVSPGIGYQSETSPLPQWSASRTPGEPISPLVFGASGPVGARRTSPFPSQNFRGRTDSPFASPAEQSYASPPRFDSLDSPRPLIGSPFPAYNSPGPGIPQPPPRGTPTSPFPAKSPPVSGAGGHMRRHSSNDGLVRRPSALSPSPGSNDASPYSARTPPTGFFGEASSQSPFDPPQRKFSVDSAPASWGDPQSSSASRHGEIHATGTRPTPGRGATRSLLRSDSAPVEPYEPNSPFLAESNRPAAHSENSEQQAALQ